MPVSLPFRIHASTISLNGLAAIIRGASGAGKSDLALRCLAEPAGGVSGHKAQLVADDYSEIFEREGELLVRAPKQIAGRLEVRGLGIVDMPFAREAKLGLVVDLVDVAEIARLPDPVMSDLAGHRFPVLRLDASKPSAPLKLLLVLDRLQETGAMPGRSSQ